MVPSPLLSIGELSCRTGLSVSAIRFYEARGLVAAVRSAGNQRRFLRADIRRLSFALIAQQLGLTLAEIQAELAQYLAQLRRRRRLKPSRHFVGVGRIDAAVIHPGQQQYRWVVRAVLDVMQRRISE